ncbi:MAG: M1 family metallopeptidase [Bacteroidia bacterium]|nr:M1 family metallopeptidase [Bacteroidia bacterium]
MGQPFTHQDTLRGSITPERVWWDLTHYDLSVVVDPKTKRISGSNLMSYTVLDHAHRMQIDLQDPMQLSRASQDGKEVTFEREGNVYYLSFPEEQMQGEKRTVLLEFEGKPKISKMPPWDGGFTWKLDKNKIPFIATSCQGDGASLWWPCKDHMYDEPRGMDIRVTVPADLFAVSNGRLMDIDSSQTDLKTFHWTVKNPINNYGVNVNVGDYVHFSEVYEGEKGPLDCDYYVLRDELEAAKKQFIQVPMMLEAFEHWFGPYPFYEDSYKLVQVPYLGMEHQSSVTYGNDFKNGYRGSDLSGTGWGLKFDFIIIHESGHEWFANNITYQDIADMWIHEGFTAYSENLYLDYHFGTQASADYVIGTRMNIQNDRPIIGQYDVNHSGSSDMYYKGANMLHTLRQLIGDDEAWRGILRGLNKDFYHQTVTTQQIEDYLSEHSGLDLQHFFDQYLRDKRVPRLEYKIDRGTLSYKWSNCLETFDMPVKVKIGETVEFIHPTTAWQQKDIPKRVSEIEVDRNFLLRAIQVE